MSGSRRIAWQVAFPIAALIASASPSHSQFATFQKLVPHSYLSDSAQAAQKEIDSVIFRLQRELRRPAPQAGDKTAIQKRYDTLTQLERSYKETLAKISDSDQKSLSQTIDKTEKLFKKVKAALPPLPTEEPVYTGGGSSALRGASIASYGQGALNNPSAFFDRNTRKPDEAGLNAPPANGSHFSTEESLTDQGDSETRFDKIDLMARKLSAGQASRTQINAHVSEVRDQDKNLLGFEMDVTRLFEGTADRSLEAWNLAKDALSVLSRYQPLFKQDEASGFQFSHPLVSWLSEMIQKQDRLDSTGFISAYVRFDDQARFSLYLIRSNGSKQIQRAHFSSDDQDGRQIALVVPTPINVDASGHSQPSYFSTRWREYFSNGAARAAESAGNPTEAGKVFDGYSNRQAQDARTPVQAEDENSRLAALAQGLPNNSAKSDSSAPSSNSSPNSAGAAAASCKETLAANGWSTGGCESHPTVSLLWTGLLEAFKEQFTTAKGIILNLAFILIGYLLAALSGFGAIAALVVKLVSMSIMLFMIGSLLYQGYGAFKEYASSSEVSRERASSLFKMGKIGGTILILALLNLIGWKIGKLKAGKTEVDLIEQKAALLPGKPAAASTTVEQIPPRLTNPETANTASAPAAGSRIAEQNSTLNTRRNYSDPVAKSNQTMLEGKLQAPSKTALTHEVAVSQIGEILDASTNGAEDMAAGKAAKVRFTVNHQTRIIESIEDISHTPSALSKLAKARLKLSAKEWNNSITEQNSDAANPQIKVSWEDPSDPAASVAAPRPAPAVLTSGVLRDLSGSPEATPPSSSKLPAWVQSIQKTIARMMRPRGSVGKTPEPAAEDPVNAPPRQKAILKDTPPAKPAAESSPEAIAEPEKLAEVEPPTSVARPFVPRPVVNHAAVAQASPSPATDKSKSETAPQENQTGELSADSQSQNKSSDNQNASSQDNNSGSNEPKTDANNGGIGGGGPGGGGGGGGGGGRGGGGEGEDGGEGPGGGGGGKGPGNHDIKANVPSGGGGGAGDGAGGLGGSGPGGLGDLSPGKIGFSDSTTLDHPSEGGVPSGPQGSGVSAPSQVAGSPAAGDANGGPSASGGSGVSAAAPASASAAAPEGDKKEEAEKKDAAAAPVGGGEVGPGGFGALHGRSKSKGLSRATPEAEPQNRISNAEAGLPGAPAPRASAPDEDDGTSLMGRAMHLLNNPYFAAVRSMATGKQMYDLLAHLAVVGTVIFLLRSDLLYIISGRRKR